MTDLELTKACADAMGWESKESRPDSKGRTYIVRRTPMDHMQDVWTVFDPLREDAHAMALVKRFELRIDHNEVNGWSACKDHGFTRPPEQGFSSDLNRAIVQCAAQLPPPAAGGPLKEKP